MARSDNQGFSRRGWYEARDTDGSSTVVYITGPIGYDLARKAFKVRPRWAGRNLDTIRVENEDRLHIIAPDDWTENKRRYGINRRFPHTTEGESYLGTSKAYKNWNQWKQDKRRTSPPGNRGHYGPARSAMAGRRGWYPRWNVDRATQSQYHIGGSPRIGLLAGWG